MCEKSEEDRKNGTTSIPSTDDTDVNFPSDDGAGDDGFTSSVVTDSFFSPSPSFSFFDAAVAVVAVDEDFATVDDAVAVDVVADDGDGA